MENAGRTGAAGGRGDTEMMIEPRFLIDLKGKGFVLYPGLLDLATRSGLVSLEVRLLQIPAPENGERAIAEAVAVFAHSRRFSEVGDAAPENLAPAMRSASCRMAATRSKARVLRDALNVSCCSLEELPPQDEERHEQTPPRPMNGNGNGHQADNCSGCGTTLRPAQVTYSWQKHGRVVCLDCAAPAAGRRRRTGEGRWGGAGQG